MVSGYELIDSGDGCKLERFGERIISRPSSLCAWKRRKDRQIWEAADATLKEKGDWQIHGRPFEEWNARIADVNLNLRLNPNGQIGVFPEHALYLDEISASITRIGKLSPSGSVRMLNLFAYTGLATIAALQAAHDIKLEVTHVDLAKRAIEWAKGNLSLNGIIENRVRWIVDDALGFMAREARKGSRYEIIVIDPPSFSRISKNNSWTLEEMLPNIMELIVNILSESNGAVFFTNHSSINTVDIARNITLDHFGEREIEIETHPLVLTESNSPRRLPSGGLITIKY